MPKYITTIKHVGETPLQATERARTEYNIPQGVPLAYAGRLDPMASGFLLILVGNECKVQTKYHALDKEYEFEVLLGIDSDTHDILGITTAHIPLHPSHRNITRVLRSLGGTITLPYPHFSSKTVKGKPLHTWTLEQRLHEIEVPTKTSRIYELTLRDVYTLTTDEIVEQVREKIATVPMVTDTRKSLGRDFRRDDVLASWNAVAHAHKQQTYTILSLTCVASSGTYMRTLASVIGEKLGTKALAHSIHRTRMGTYMRLPVIGGMWVRKFIHHARRP